MEGDRSNLRRAACWADARRKFHEALTDNRQRFREIITLIASLCGIEKVAREKGLLPEAWKELRQRKGPAMLDRLHRHLLELDSARVGSPVLPKSPLGKAIHKQPKLVGRIGAVPRRRPVRHWYESGGSCSRRTIPPNCLGKKK